MNLATVAFTAYVWVLALVTLAPLWLALLVVRRRIAADRLLKTWARWILRAAGWRLQVHGLEHLRGGHPVIMVANHASHLDSVVLLAALPVEYRFVANHHAAGWPLVGLALRRGRHLIVNRERAADRRSCALAMIETVRHGTSILVFPEGTIGTTTAMRPFQPGAFRIAVQTRRPIVPIILQGTAAFAGGGLLRLRRTDLEVTIAPPLHPVDRDRRESTRLRDRAREQMEIALATGRSRPRPRWLRGGEAWHG